jgi:hypothetical protein
MNQSNPIKDFTTASLFLGIVLASGNALAQGASELDAVKAANQALYAALSTLNIADMDKVWAREPYVFYVGPNTKAMTVGWPAVRAAYEASFVPLSRRTVKATDTHIRIIGSVAWVVGREEASFIRKDGTSVTGMNFVTNVLEKKDGHWLIVSHHAQRIPK